MTTKQDAPKIGDTVYTFDINRRVYRRDADGRAIGGPIYREHFRPWVIVGEEKRSWVISTDAEARFAHKIAKAGVRTQQEVDDDCWLNDHRHRLAVAVGMCNDVATLRAIASALGYEGDGR